MSTIVLTVGPQHIGKTTFCKKVIASDPTIQMVSRDEILIDLFGSPYLDEYSGGHIVAFEKMWKIVSEKIAQDNSNLILDCWNGPDFERIKIIEQLRCLNVQSVGAWYFSTPQDVCLNWRMQQFVANPNKAPKWEEFRKQRHRDSFLEKYNFFYEHATVDTTIGFDFVKRINPLEPFVVPSLFLQ